MWHVAEVCALHISRGTQQFAARNAVDSQTEERTKTKRHCDNDKAQQEVQEVK